MKRQYLMLALLILFAFDAYAQGVGLTEFNTERLQVNKTGMIVLGSWALGNIGTNAVLLNNPSSKEQAHFYRMNIFWNVVNLGLAIPGLRHAIITDPASLDMASTVSEYHKMGKILLLNAGLDVAYITGGFLMKEMAKTRPNKEDILTGYGRSLILQGGFLLAFDIILYSVLSSKGGDLEKILETVHVGANSIGLTFRF
ncbi:DUF6992 family protein [Roseivirga pacifica]|uniref:DUF6992 family protein n=1 Tax=Roseivirga pacifica TaxID=1267423 RepID=UPI003BAC7C0B